MPRVVPKAANVWQFSWRQRRAAKLALVMQRLRRRSQFQAILNGELVGKSAHFALHRIEPVPGELLACSTTYALLFPVMDTWVGAMAPKRWAKRAVTRNTIRRQIYTVCASLKKVLPQAAFLVRLRREFSRSEFHSASSPALKEAVRAELLVLMNMPLALAKSTATAS